MPLALERPLAAMIKQMIKWPERADLVLGASRSRKVVTCRARVRASALCALRSHGLSTTIVRQRM